MRAVSLALLLTAALSQPAAAQSSNAAQYLLRQNLVEACGGAGGTAAPGTVIEADLDADGRQDLLIAHEMIECRTGSAPYGRSMLCGMQVCTVRIYLRRGNLLALTTDFLGGGVTVNRNATPPLISGYAHGGGPWAIRWRDGAFR
ncbi:hypothetical protein ACN2XU_11930 [Primorskyibacter sp. 2E107]|uniref:hypothetical protein n=1 Tax=Primorskyibacter sp. 2E107 TaxID=3403458 RepID=UPI003AF87953